MDRHCLFPGYFDSDHKLTRAASFSELSTSKKVTIEEKYQSDIGGNLVKQYSCEQIYDRKSNISHVTVSEVVRSDNREQKNVWKKTVPTFIPLNNSNRTGNMDSESHKKVTRQSNVQEAPLLSIDYVKNSSNAKNILAAPKLIIGNNSAKQQYNTKNQVNPDNDQSISNKTTKDNFLFKKPLKPARKSNTSKSISVKDEKPHDDALSYDKNLIELDKAKELPSVECCQIRDDADLKSRLRRLVLAQPKKKKRAILCWSIIFVILLPITILYLGVFLNDIGLSENICNPHFKTAKLRELLVEKIHGQSSAVKNLSKYFLAIDDQVSFEVLTLIGGIGVGKSYVSEIIQNNLEGIKVLDFFPPLFRKEDQAYSSLSFCKCNLIRLENLKTDDISDAVNFINNLHKRMKNNCVLILALFNTQETDYTLKKTIDLDKSVSMIEAQFKEVGLPTNIVTFNAMDDEALTKCIKDAANYVNVELTADNIEYVKRDLIMSESGCKGAYAKVQIVGKAIKHSSEL